MALAFKPVPWIAFTKAMTSFTFIQTSAFVVLLVSMFVQLAQFLLRRNYRISGSISSKKPTPTLACKIWVMSLEVLQQLPVFTSLEPHSLERILENSQTATLPRGTRLFTTSDPPEAVYVLLSGSARTYCLTSQARELTLKRHSPPSVLGLEALLTQHQSEATLLEDSAVLVLDATTLRRLARADVLFCHTLLDWALVKHQAFVLRMGELLYADLGARLARLLLSEADGWQLPPNSLLAAELGTVPELISRKLGEFYRAGWIRLEKRRVYVISHCALQSLLETR
jgi:CRP/FNR family transcriptional regulator, dissimilatory nitrate respiration regulator